MRSILIEIAYKTLFILGGNNFANKKFNLYTLFKFLIIQKVLRINAHVPWPVHWTTQVKSPHKINKGNRNPGMSMGCYIDGRNGIEFGDNVWIGPRVSIISQNHDVKNFENYIIEKPIKIGNNCWIGTNVVILPGVELGSHIIIAAGAVVAKSYLEDNLVLAGVPAKIVKRISEYNEFN